MAIQVVQTLDRTDSLRSLSNAEKRLASSIFNTNLNYESGESIAIITDTTYVQKEAAIWFEAAKELPGKTRVTLITIDGMTHSGEEPPLAVVELCTQADISLLHTVFSLTHTKAGKAVAAHENRGFSLPGVDYAMMMRTLSNDYLPVKVLGQKLQTALTTSPTLSITSPAGTKLTTGIRQDKVYADVGFVESGEIGNLPAGEVFFAPLDGTTEGIWVVDGSMADFEATGLDEPIVIEIERGRAVNIHGLSGQVNKGKSARRLWEMLSTVGSDAFHVAEIGIGINKHANPHGDLIEAEKAYATAHLALGNSSAIGGSVNVPIHLDGVSVGVEINAIKPILKNGVFLV